MSEYKTATEVLMMERERVDLRRRNADMIAHAFWREIRDMIPDEAYEQVRDAIFDAAYRNAMTIITEAERAALGLEPRDGMGWTPSERIQAQQTEHQFLMMAMQHIIKSPP